DRPGGDADMFKKLACAYEVLGDVDRRKIYDRTGETDENAAAAGGMDDDSVRSYELGEMLKTFMDVFRNSDDEIEELRSAPD
ncbi:MAG: hypothetical protein HOA22_09470, partial [Gammaproteobacteria bacterium]|nr:hypothetical protein [Gammaproteobacteria bacterium]